VSYKAEQRFHLELGMLKLVHAQRLLPLEQLLSGAVSAQPSIPAARSGSAPGLKPAPSAAPARTAPGTSPFSDARTSRPSPFEADRARKSREDMSTPPMIGEPIPPKSQGAGDARTGTASVNGTALAVAVVEAPPEVVSGGVIDIAAIRETVLLDMQDQKTLYGPLEDGEWIIEGNEVVVKTSLSATLIEFAFNAELKRRAITAVGRAAGRPMRFRIAGGATAEQVKPKNGPRGTGGGARAKAAQHPVVQKMMDKFGAEIRTVLDPESK